MRTALIAGNWKMFGLRRDLRELDELASQLAGAKGVEVAICPPATLLADARLHAAGTFEVGAQDCSPLQPGAHTGDVSVAMIADTGARYVIAGHSERRKDHVESDALVRAKAEAAVAGGLVPIVCVGETLEERRQGRAAAVTAAQIEASVPRTGAFVLAYEPVWAIGTGLTPSTGEIEEIHAAARAAVAAARGPDVAASTRILYGGSVKPVNAAEIFAIDGVDGALVGGASLKAEDFFAIIAAHPSFRAA